MLRIDLHTDTPLKICKYGLNISEDSTCKVDIPKLRRGNISVVFFAIFTKDIGERAKEDYFWEAHRKILLTHANIVSRYEYISRAYHIEDIYALINSEKIVILFGMENGRPIENKLDNIRFFYNRGIRYLTLCHNRTNQICDSSTDSEVYKGLSDFGRDVIYECNRIGMIIDVSHASDKTVEQVLNLSTKPIIASHSCCYAINKNPRNLKDYLIKGIAERGGVIGITLYNKLVSTKKVVELAHVVKHIQHIKELVGIDYISIGSDFDGEPLGNEGIKDCQNIGEVRNLDAELKRWRFSDEEIAKIWGKNFIRVFKENEK